MWDTEVDVVVIGAGIAGMANAIAAADAGGTVLIADARRPVRHEAGAVAVRTRVGAGPTRLLPDTLDPETMEYFEAVTEGLSADSPADLTVPRRNARNLSREETDGRVVETFRGSRLHGWATTCAPSPYGLLYSNMQGWLTTTMRSEDGESIEVLSVGTISWGEDFGGDDLRHWLDEQARQRDIEVETASTLQRIVFEEGVIVGVVLDTPEGPLAVRAVAGIAFSPTDDGPTSGAGDTAVDGERLQVCLVGRTASRFGRVELLTTEPAVARPNCTGSRRQLREGLHEARQLSLEGWRCGNVHGYPALGQ